MLVYNDDNLSNTRGGALNIFLTLIALEILEKFTTREASSNLPYDMLYNMYIFFSLFVNPYKQFLGS